MFQAEEITSEKTEARIISVHGKNSEIRKVGFLEAAGEQITQGLAGHGKNTGLYPKHDKKPLESFDLT